MQRIRSIAGYYNLKGLWDRYKTFKNPSKCTYEAENDDKTPILMELNDSKFIIHIKRKILMMGPLSTLSKMQGLIIQEKRTNTLLQQFCTTDNALAIQKQFRSFGKSSEGYS